MSFEWVIRDLLEIAMVVAIGGMLVSAVIRIRRGEIVAYHCPQCQSAISRAYRKCPKCKHAQP
jgi:Zn finger protein HypA/HybF involved in hydrogenase expression